MWPIACSRHIHPFVLRTSVILLEAAAVTNSNNDWLFDSAPPTPKAMEVSLWNASISAAFDRLPKVQPSRCRPSSKRCIDPRPGRRPMCRFQCAMSCCGSSRFGRWWFFSLSLFVGVRKNANPASSVVVDVSKSGEDSPKMIANYGIIHLKRSRRGGGRGRNGWWVNERLGKRKWWG